MRGRRIGATRCLTSRELERQRETNRKMTALGLHCHLLNLIREIRAGETDKLVDFQQMLRYAPPEMCLAVLAELETTRGEQAA